MASYTTNYRLPKYDSTDKPNLRDQYNEAMDTIDSTLNQFNTNIGTANTKADSAVTTANGLQSQVTKAQSDATKAQSDATKGITDAAAAQSTANKAINDASTAQTSANKAISQANAQKIMLAIGDSFGVDSVTSPNWWHTYVAKGLGLIDKNFCEGFDGFVTTNPSSNKNFTNKVEDAYNDSSFDNELVEYIVCYGGLNDHSQSDGNTIKNGIRSFASKCHELFPKAKLVIAGPTSWYAFTLPPSFQTTYGSFNILMETYLAELSGECGYSYIDLTYCTFGETTYYAGTGDGSHFTSAGSQAAAGAILSGINGYGYTFIQTTYNNCAVKLAKDNTQVGTASIIMKRLPNGLHFYGIITPTEAINKSNVYIEIPNKVVMNLQQFTGNIGISTDQVLSGGYPARLNAPSKEANTYKGSFNIDELNDTNNGLVFVNFTYISGI